MNRKTEMQNVLRNMLLQLKSEGLRVFQANTQWGDAYGFITDGRDVVTIVYDDITGLRLSYEYVPSKENGSGVVLNDFKNQSGKISRKMFEQAVKEGCTYAYSHDVEFLSDKYKDLVDYMLSAFSASNYKEL